MASRSSPHCLICQRPALRRRGDVHEYGLFACRQCRIEFLDPQPDDPALARIYGDTYFLGQNDADAAARRSRMKSATAAWYLDILGRYVRPSHAELLEIGCGHGELLMQARGRGFRVSGLEISPAASAAANRELGAGTVQAGTIETVDLPSNRFDAVVAADVIEHLRDPQAFLVRIVDLLAPGGTALLVTPSLDSWTRKLMGRHWMEYKVEHLWYFGALSLRSLLERCGFSDIRIFPGRKVLTLDYLWLHFERFRVPLVSSLLRLGRRAVPPRLARRHMLVPAANLMAIARRPSP